MKLKITGDYDRTTALIIAECRKGIVAVEVVNKKNNKGEIVYLTKRPAKIVAKKLIRITQNSAGYAKNDI